MNDIDYSAWGWIFRWLIGTDEQKKNTWKKRINEFALRPNVRKKLLKVFKMQIFFQNKKKRNIRKYAMKERSFDFIKKHPVYYFSSKADFPLCKYMRFEKECRLKLMKLIFPYFSIAFIIMLVLALWHNFQWVEECVFLQTEPHTTNTLKNHGKWWTTRAKQKNRKTHENRHRFLFLYLIIETLPAAFFCNICK